MSLLNLETSNLQCRDVHTIFQNLLNLPLRNRSAVAARIQYKYSMILQHDPSNHTAKNNYNGDLNGRSMIAACFNNAY